MDGLSHDKYMVAELLVVERYLNLLGQLLNPAAVPRKLANHGLALQLLPLVLVDVLV